VRVEDVIIDVKDGNVELALMTELIISVGDEDGVWMSQGQLPHRARLFNKSAKACQYQDYWRLSSSNTTTDAADMVIW
jgi:hypothetical protein